MIIAQKADGERFRFPEDEEPMWDPEGITNIYGEWFFTNNTADPSLLLTTSGCTLVVFDKIHAR